MNRLNEFRDELIKLCTRFEVHVTTDDGEMRMWVGDENYPGYELEVDLAKPMQAELEAGYQAVVGVKSE